ncbi:MAG: hypothetical protein ACKOPS_27290 [Cyanobium sp.]
MAESLPPVAPAPGRSGPAQILQVPLPLLRYHQRLPEQGRAGGPERIDGPALPEHHVLHRTLDF